MRLRQSGGFRSFTPLAFWRPTPSNCSFRLGGGGGRWKFWKLGSKYSTLTQRGMARNLIRDPRLNGRGTNASRHHKRMVSLISLKPMQARNPSARGGRRQRHPGPFSFAASIPVRCKGSWYEFLLSNRSLSRWSESQVYLSTSGPAQCDRYRSSRTSQITFYKSFSILASLAASIDKNFSLAQLSMAWGTRVVVGVHLCLLSNRFGYFGSQYVDFVDQMLYAHWFHPNLSPTTHFGVVQLVFLEQQQRDTAELDLVTTPFTSIHMTLGRNG